jgi:hypothetical protein
MAIETSTTVETVADGYHRVYVPAEMRADSQYPLADGQDVRLRIIGPGVVLVPARKGSLTEQIAAVVKREVL